MDKFGKLSLNDVEWSTKDSDGEEHHFTFKPLSFASYPKIYELFGKLQQMSPDTEGDNFLNNVEESTIKQLVDMEKEMVMISYPDKSEDDVERFVMSNLFDLIEPLSQICFPDKK